MNVDGTALYIYICMCIYIRMYSIAYIICMYKLCKNLPLRACFPCLLTQRVDTTFPSQAACFREAVKSAATSEKDATVCSFAWIVVHFLNWLFFYRNSDYNPKNFNFGQNCFGLCIHFLSHFFLPTISALLCLYLRKQDEKKTPDSLDWEAIHWWPSGASHPNARPAAPGDMGICHEAIQAVGQCRYFNGPSKSKTIKEETLPEFVCLLSMMSFLFVTPTGHSNNLCNII